MNLAIAHTDPAALIERCEVTGVRIASGEPEYEDGAILPAGPWRPLTTELAASLKPTTGTSDSTLVELIKLPDGPPPTSLAALADPLGDPDAVHLGQAASPAKALTTTPNYKDGRRIGLHLDNCDKLDYQTKHTGRRRLCINLGPGTRYLLLGALDIQTICRTIHHDRSTATRTPTTCAPTSLAATRSASTASAWSPARATSPPPNSCLTTAPPRASRSRPPPPSGSATGHAEYSRP
ncbi:hypothetical protein ACIQI7_06725 [Kitasatospora sp. NPDC092039]|uniref:hypothetical protein n=1 Tax=Kitasatospora sp. NPDC092039 TaxID=3364086 RepID=UPI0037F8A483